MSLPSGHKRINSSVNQFSGQKSNPRGTIVSLPFQSSGAKQSSSKESFTQGKVPMMNISTANKQGKVNNILFHNAPLKLEGELSITKTTGRDTHSKNYRNANSRSNTPNKGNSINNSSRGFGSTSLGPSLANNSKLPINKIKKLDLSATKDRSINKNKSYYNPKTARDNLNLSGVSGTSKTRYNDSNHSFLISDLLNKTRNSSFNRTGFSNLSARSATPNSKSNNKLAGAKLNKSNTDLSKIKKVSQSKSPNPPRLTNKININKVSLSPNSRTTSSTRPSSKNKFDSNMLKQLQDFKNNKSPTPHIFKQINNTSLSKPSNLGSKFGAALNVKRVVTGNLLSMNMQNNNTNDVSTNSTFISKDVYSYSNNGTNNSNVGVINIVKKDSKENETQISPNIIQSSGNNNAGSRTNNLAKEKDSKVPVDFKEITTSPLLRKKPDLMSVKEIDLNNPLLSKLNINQVTSKINPNTKTNNVPQNQNLVVKKTIKLIHEYSKVGYSGPGVRKVNQDNYFVFKNFVGNPNHFYMSVCDGHGILGHEVSGYLRENLPVNLSNQLRNKNQNLSIPNVSPIIEEVFLDINHKLHSNEIIDTTFSGSTCVSVIYTPEKLVTANVGDSRAVLGRCVNGEWISHDLTRDHKPNDKDESVRIKKRGGRIEPFRDDDGEFIGPHRVWLKEDDIPGLAMSRSFGDKVASSVGVIAEPEIIEYKFKEEDKFFIIASDGVWEFIESRECVNIIKEFYFKNDILGCCEYIHKESCARWMREEEVIDDITMIIVFLE